MRPCWSSRWAQRGEGWRRTRQCALKAGAVAPLVNWWTWRFPVVESIRGSARVPATACPRCANDKAPALRGLDRRKAELASSSVPSSRKCPCSCNRYGCLQALSSESRSEVARHAASVVQSAMILQARRLATDSQFWRGDQRLLRLVLGVTLESASPQKLQQLQLDTRDYSCKAPGDLARKSKSSRAAVAQR